MATKTVYYDRYGGFQGENPAPPIEKVPYKVKEVGGGVTYLCYTPTDENGNCVVEKITDSSSSGVQLTTREHGFGSWDDPSGITFYPINEAIPVTQEV